MPPLPSVPNVIRVALRGQLSEDTDYINRWFMSYVGPPPDTSACLSFAAFVNSQWVATMLPLQGSYFTLVNTTVTDLSGPLGSEAAAAGAGSGSRGGTGPDPATSLVLQHRISRRYRGGHCRTYLWCGIDTDRADDQTWSAGFLALVSSQWSSMMTALGTFTDGAFSVHEQVNVSYFSGFTNFTFPSGRVRAVPTRRAVPLVDVITSTTGNPKLGSQRRRNLQPK